MIRVDLELRRGGFPVRAAFETGARVSGLFGPSGSGKTSVLLALAGLLEPVRGRIEVGGTVLYDSSRSVAVPPERRRVGMVFQEGRLFPHLTVAGNLRFARPGPAVAGPAFDEVVHLFDLEPLLDRGVGEISGGQARLVAVARALLSRPRLLLLDEPLTGLDPERRRTVLAYLLRLRETLDVRMLYVSHVFADFLALVQEMAVMRSGELATWGTPAELFGAALGSAEAGTVQTTLPGRVAAVDEAGHATVDCAGARLELTLPGAREGTEVWITVDAQDVLLAVGDLPATSARNSLAGTVRELRPAGANVLVAVEAGPVIWAEITPRSVAELALAPGRPVHVLVKSSALRGVAL